MTTGRPDPQPTDLSASLADAAALDRLIKSAAGPGSGAAPDPAFRTRMLATLAASRREASGLAAWFSGWRLAAALGIAGFCGALMPSLLAPALQGGAALGGGSEETVVLAELQSFYGIALPGTDLEHAP